MNYQRKRLFVFVLALVLILNTGLLTAVSGEGGTGDTALLQDGGFETDIWSGSPWEFKVENWDSDTTIRWDGGNFHDGSHSVNYWSGIAKAITVSQDVELEAGTYKLAAWNQGENSTFQLFVGDKKGTAAGLTGFGTWDTAEEEFVIDTKGTYTVGVILDCESGGWGYLDSISLVKTADASSGNNEGYVVSVTPETVNAEPGETVTLTAVVTYNGKKITDLEDAGLELYWWSDKWVEGHEDGLTDAECSVTDGHALTVNMLLPSQGVYYIAVQLKQGSDTLAQPFVTCKVKSNAAVKADIDVVKVPGLSDDFIMGMDISSVMSEFASGVTYRDFEGNVIDNITGFCKFLKQCGVTSVRVRIWNHPYDTAGKGYGGGNNDIETAVEIAKGCQEAGLDMLLDFHCSDFWTDPGKQQAPKAWKSYSVEQKADALKEFLTDSLTKVAATGVNIAMVQVGNETTSGFIGETSTEKMCILFNAGAAAVRSFDSDIRVVIHVTNPEKSQMTVWAKHLADNNVDYDVLATSYYPSWHGTFANLKNQLATVKKMYGKDVMVAETSYAFTLEDTDGHENTIRAGNNDTMVCGKQYPFTFQGQASYLRDLIATVNEAGGLGVFYWESAWITVGNTAGLTGNDYDERVKANKALWERYGSGWASSYSAQYEPEDAGKWYGGSAVDNQAMFAADGSALPSISVWKLAGLGAESSHITVEAVDTVKVTIEAGGKYSLPDTVTVTYNKETVEETVRWDEEDLAAVDANVSGTYVIKGTVTLSKTVDFGSYAGKTTVPVSCTLTIKAANLVGADWSFENGDAGFTGLDLTGKGITGETPYEGSKCLHWYLMEGKTVKVTYNSGITLEPGKYTFECKAQGYAGDKVALNILAHGTDKVLVKGDNIMMAGWKEWKTPAVSFTMTETATVDLQMVVNVQTGGWGTIDCMYLYKTGDISSTLVDDETEITISALEELSGLDLVVDKIDESAAAYGVISNAVGKEYSDLLPFDIYLKEKNSGTVAEFNGAVTVKIPLPKGWSAAGVKVFHVTDNGTAEDMKAAVDEKNNCVLFTTNHFSYYVLAKKGSTPTESETPAESSSTPTESETPAESSGTPTESETPAESSSTPTESGTSAESSQPAPDTGRFEDEMDDNDVDAVRSPGTGDTTPVWFMSILCVAALFGCMVMAIQFYRAEIRHHFKKEG